MEFFVDTTVTEGEISLICIALKDMSDPANEDIVFDVSTVPDTATGNGIPSTNVHVYLPYLIFALGYLLLFFLIFFLYFVQEWIILIYLLELK